MGGGEVVAAWMLQALLERYEVTVLTFAQPDFDAVNRMFGTRLEPDGIRIIRPHPVLRYLVNLLPDPFNTQKIACLLRIARRRSRDFNAVVASTTMECDMGDSRSMQYIHFPSSSIAKLTTPGDGPWISRIAGLLRGSTRPWMVMARFDFRRVAKSRLIANSAYTASKVEQLYRTACRIVHPPAPGLSYSSPWGERPTAGFFSAGRLNSGKRHDWIIETLAEVRQSFPELRLHIVGMPDAPYRQSAYEARLRALVQQHQDWVHLHISVPREELARLASNCRYGIHAMRDEHFGIAAAESLLAGSIPFVHASGGQVEIVGRNPALCFDSREDAVQKITAVLGDEDRQRHLRESLAPLAEQFTPAAFVRRIQEETEALLAG